jgi:beta-glucosidase
MRDKGIAHIGMGTATGEDRCMADISISHDQIELAKRAKACGKQVVGVIFCGRPLVLTEIEPYLDAIICAWHCGSRGANVAAKMLFGEYNPSGKCPVTFVRNTGHIPFYYNCTMMGREHLGYYGEHPECCYVDHPAAPMYPFGYGLSYTTFEYSDITLERSEISLDDVTAGGKLKASVKVRNTGERSGKETVQLYVRDLIGSLMRPLRELKDFKKPLIKAGESVTLEFEVGADKLGFYNNDGEYVIEKGKFEIYIGENCLTKNKVTVDII